MKPVQILLLVAAGAMGGAMVTRVWHRPAAPSAEPPVAAQTRSADPAPPAAVPEPAAAATPVAQSSPALQPEVEPAKPSPIPKRREAPKPQPMAKKAPPPPANPRPVVTAARVEPQPLPVPPPVRIAPAPVREAPPVVPTPPVRSPEPEYAAPVPPPPPPPEPNRVTLNTGVLVPVRLVDGLSSERNVGGDTFTGTLDREIVVDGFVIAERGARVDGRVVNVDRGGKVKGVATMAIELTRIRTSDGQTVPIQTDAFERRAEASRQTDAAKVGGGAALGAIIGAIAGGAKGAAIGAGVGGGAGAGDVLLTRGKPVTFPTETRISFRLRAPVTITERP